MIDTTGAVVSRRCRETGEMVGLYRDLSSDYPWEIVCEAHAFTSGFNTRREAEQFLSHPKSEGWCEVCSGAWIDPR